MPGKETTHQTGAVWGFEVHVMVQASFKRSAWISITYNDGCILLSTQHHTTWTWTCGRLLFELE